MTRCCKMLKNVVAYFKVVVSEGWHTMRAQSHTLWEPGRPAEPSERPVRTQQQSTSVGGDKGGRQGGRGGETQRKLAQPFSRKTAARALSAVGHLGDAPSVSQMCCPVQAQVSPHTCGTKPIQSKAPITTTLQLVLQTKWVGPGCVCGLFSVINSIGMCVGYSCVVESSLPLGGSISAPGCLPIRPCLAVESMASCNYVPGLPWVFATREAGCPRTAAHPMQPADTTLPNTPLGHILRIGQRAAGPPFAGWQLLAHLACQQPWSAWPSYTDTAIRLLLHACMHTHLPTPQHHEH
jgi:hypothetical protein